MLRITTTFTTTANGSARVVARGAGKQRTVVFDHSLSPQRNHVEAVASLIAGTNQAMDVLGRQDSWKHETVSTDKHVWEV